VLLVILLSTVLLYSRTFFEVNELDIPGIGICDGQVCLMGLLLGVSTWDEAISTLKAHNLGVQVLLTSGAS
jgi:hypothetical protein